MAHELVGATTQPPLRAARALNAGARLAFETVPTRVAVYAIAIFVFSALDAALTLTMIDAGFAREVNPFMRMLMEIDMRLFLNVKLAVTGLALMYLAACSGRVVFGRVRIVQILSCLVGLYVLLIGYEICILMVGLFG